eukprot:403343836
MKQFSALETLEHTQNNPYFNPQQPVTLNLSSLKLKKYETQTSSPQKDYTTLRSQKPVTSTNTFRLMPRLKKVDQSQSKKQKQAQIKEQIERDFQAYRITHQNKNDTNPRDSHKNLMNLNSSQPQNFTCKDFVKTLHKKDTLDYNHILLYKSIQPFPLRESIEKLKIRDASKILDPPKANQVEIMKLNNIRDYLHKNQEIAQTQRFMIKNSKTGSGTQNRKTGARIEANAQSIDFQTLVKNEYINNLKDRMKSSNTLRSMKTERFKSQITNTLNTGATGDMRMNDDSIANHQDQVLPQKNIKVNEEDEQVYTQFKDQLAKNSNRQAAIEELRGKLQSQKDSPKKLSDIEKRAESQPLYFYKYQKPDQPLKSMSRASIGSIPISYEISQSPSKSPSRYHSRQNSRSNNNQIPLGMKQLSQQYQSQSQLTNHLYQPSLFNINPKKIDNKQGKNIQPFQMNIEDVTNRINLFSQQKNKNQDQRICQTNLNTLRNHSQKNLLDSQFNNKYQQCNFNFEDYNNQSKQNQDFTLPKTHSTMLSPINNPIQRNLNLNTQVQSVQSALNFAKEKQISKSKQVKNVVLKQNSIPIFQTTASNSFKNTRRSLGKQTIEQQDNDYQSPIKDTNYHTATSGFRGSGGFNISYKNSKIGQSQSKNNRQDKNHSKNRSLNSSCMSRQSQETNKKLLNLIENCDSQTKNLKNQRNLITKNKKQMRQMFNQFKSRVRFNMQVNRQESLPEDMLDIKCFRLESQRNDEKDKEKQEILQLEEMASKYNNWKVKLDRKLKEQEQITIKETKQFLDGYKSKSQNKAEKIPAKIKQNQLNAVLEDKTLIEIYNNFELQFLNHTKHVREENFHRKKEIQRYNKPI